MCVKELKKHVHKLESDLHKLKDYDAYVGRIQPTSGESPWTDDYSLEEGMVNEEPADDSEPIKA